jgi:hypothetical protein
VSHYIWTEVLSLEQVAYDSAKLGIAAVSEQQGCGTLLKAPTISVPYKTVPFPFNSVEILLSQPSTHENSLAYNSQRLAEASPRSLFVNDLDNESPNWKSKSRHLFGKSKGFTTQSYGTVALSPIHSQTSAETVLVQPSFPRTLACLPFFVSRLKRALDPPTQ